MKADHLKGSALLLLCAIIWGFAFASQAVTLNALTFTYRAIKDVPPCYCLF